MCNEKVFDHINPCKMCIYVCVCVCICVLSAAVWDLLLLLFEPWQQLLFYVATHKSEQTRISICEKHTSYVQCVCVCPCVRKESVCVSLRLRRKTL